MRAQIARISLSTNLTPKGLHQFVEDSKEREIEDKAPPEEGEPYKPTVKDMCTMSNWLHKDASILLQGRTKHAEGKPNPGEEDVDPEVL